MLNRCVCACLAVLCALFPVIAQEKNDVVELGPLFVTAEDQERSPLQQPDVEPIGLGITMSAVGLEDLYRQKPVTLSDALEFAPGSWTETRGRKVRQFTSFRGQTYPYPDYAIDGLWFREFAELPYLFPAVELERIEVIRSSSALLRGLSGIAGVINLVPRRYEQRHTYAEAEGGQDSTLRAYVAHNEPLADGGVYAALGHYQSDGHRDFGAERMDSAAIRYGQQVSESVSFDANLFIVDGDREFIQAQQPAAARLKTWREQYDPYRAVIGTARLVYQPESGRTTELAFWGSDRQSTFRQENPSAGATTEHDDDDYEYGVQALQSVPLGEDNVLRVGGLYHHWVSPDGKRFYSGRRADIHTLSGVVVDEKTIGRLTLDGGVRVSREFVEEFGAFSIEGSGTPFRTVAAIEDDWAEPLYRVNMGGRFAANDSVALYVNYGFGQVDPRQGALTESGDTPDTERRHSMDAGLVLSSGWLKTLKLGGFYTLRDDAVLLTGATFQDAAGLEVETYGNEDVSQYGLEFECRSQPLWDRVSLFVNALVMDSRTEDETGHETDYEEVPDEVVKAGAYVTVGSVDLSVYGQYLGEYENDRFSDDGTPKPLGAFVDLNLLAGVSFGRDKHTRVYGKVANLLDDEYSTVVGYYDAGRRVSVGVQHVF